MKGNLIILVCFKKIKKIIIFSINFFNDQWDVQNNKVPLTLKQLIFCWKKKNDNYMSINKIYLTA